MYLLHRTKQTSLVPSGDPAPNKPKKPSCPQRQKWVLSLPRFYFLQTCLGLVVSWGMKKASFESIQGLPAPDWTTELVRTFHRVPHVKSRCFGDSTCHSSLESFAHPSPYPRAAARIRHGKASPRAHTTQRAACCEELREHICCHVSKVGSVPQTSKGTSKERHLSLSSCSLSGPPQHWLSRVNLGWG